MRIRLNGTPTEVPADMSLAELLQWLGMNGRPVAVELNGEVVSRSRHAGVHLREGDCVEIVTFVGGG